MSNGWVFNIQRFSVHDGPGIRTTVFLKGCNLRCWWCHNPESWRMGTDIEVHPERCIGCLACTEVCPHGARTAQDGNLVFQRDLCVRCGDCAKVCYAGAIEEIGRQTSAETIVEEALRDRAFYEESGGGVTLSGGEPLLQPAFSREILALCKANDLSTAVDTAGCVPWSAFDAAIPYTDLFLLDIKALDPQLHRTGTVQDNALILENAAMLGRGNVPIWVRVPVVPGFNDDPSEISAIARFCADLPAVQRIELLAYHRLGFTKSEGLGSAVPGRMVEPPCSQKMEQLAQIVASFGLEARVR